MNEKLQPEGELTIIFPATAASVAPRRKADEGGRRDSEGEGFASRYAAKSIGKASAQMDKVLGELENLLAAIRDSPIGQMELSSVEVGLAITVEGTIGVATAGAEASISLTFERIKP